MSARATLALAAGLLAGGGAFGLPSLYVPALALLLLTAGTATWVLLAARGARLERLPGPRSVVEDEPYPLRFRLRAGVLAPRGALADPLLDRPIPISLTGRRGIRVRRRSEVALAEQARFSRRGRHRLGLARMLIGDPLGICSRRVTGSDGEVLVLPRVEPVIARSGGAGGRRGAGEWEGPGTHFGAAADAEIDGLRPYRSGSPASRIHWPAVARRGELIERRLASGGAGAVLVVLDATEPASPEALDRAVRAAGSLCVHFARTGGCTLIVPGAARPLHVDAELRGWPEARAQLALVEPGGAPGRALRAARGGTTFWVTAAQAGSVPPTLPPGSFVVTPIAGDRERARFTVAGCYGLPPAGRAGPARTRSAA